MIKIQNDLLVADAIAMRPRSSYVLTGYLTMDIISDKAGYEAAQIRRTMGTSFRVANNYDMPI
jgi:hypothetical protein